MAPLTTFHIGGEAKFFVEIASVGDLVEAVKFAKDKNLPIFVLGGGSNILISDDGFNGLVIKINICGIRHLWINDLRSRLSTRSQDSVILTAGAGEAWDDVVAKAVELNAGGIENLSLIPGTVGGAVAQNIGAYGVEIKDVIKSVKIYDTKNGNTARLSDKECCFGYRSSIFKENKDLIVLEAEFMLSKNHIPDVSYPDLAAEFNGKNPSIAEIRNAVIKIRKNKLPYPDEIGNAGSFFKNPTVKISNYQLLISNYPDLKGRDIGNGLVKLSAAQLIEKAGWKGKRLGNVGVSEKHALVLVNYGRGKAKELANLEAMMKESVEAKFGINMELEVEKVAF